jgi:acetoin utilization deacetylase AcuC-like enzyme
VESLRRLEAALAGIRSARNSGVEIEEREPQMPPSSALEGVHSLRYLERVRESVQRGGGPLGPDTSTNEHSLRSAELAVGAAISAVDSAIEGTTSFAPIRPPGHHAGPGYSMGFCLLNNAAVAAAHARSRGLSRIAILDWDVHHGNGTQHVFYEDPDVLYLSAHRSPFYPGTGDVEESGEGEGGGFTVNVPLPAGSGDEEYTAVFTGIFLPVLREFEPELLIVSAGYDCHRADPLGGMGLGGDSFGEFAAAVSVLCDEVGAAPRPSCWRAATISGRFRRALRPPCAESSRGRSRPGGTPRRWRPFAGQEKSSPASGGRCGSQRRVSPL